MKATAMASGNVPGAVPIFGPGIEALRGLRPRDIATGIAASLLFSLLRGYFLVDAYAKGHALLPALPGALLRGIVLVVAVKIADAYVRRGAAPLPAFAAAVVVSAVGSAVSEWYLARALGGQLFFGPEAPLAVQRTEMLFASVMQVVHSGFVVAIYLQWREREAIARRLRQSELRRVDDERRMQEARLGALQARLDPGFLFAALQRVGELTDTAAARAERLLDDIITLLRLLTEGDGAAPQGVGTTLENELAIAAADLRVRNGCDGGLRELNVEIEADAATAHVPPMLIMPLVRAIACGEDARRLRLGIRAALGGGEMTLFISRNSGDGDEPIVDDEGLAGYRRFLDEHFASGTARVAMDLPASLRLHLRIGHEPA